LLATSCDLLLSRQCSSQLGKVRDQLADKEKALSTVALQNRTASM
jgi:hypothetical protein